MKSGKQRRAELRAAREKRARKAQGRRRAELRREVTAGMRPCNPEKLAPYNSYGAPDFVTRGYYYDVRFACIDCGVEEVWTAAQQKWWYETAKGNVESTANRCRSCRRKERRRREEARRVHLEGLERKRG